MLSDAWGRDGWDLTHAAALRLDASDLSPPAKRDRAARFFRELQRVLPCGRCRAHCLKELRAAPAPTGADVFRYTYELHDSVNRRLGKPGVPFRAALAQQSLRLADPMAVGHVVMRFALVCAENPAAARAFPDFLAAWLAMWPGDRVPLAADLAEELRRAPLGMAARNVLRRSTGYGLRAEVLDYALAIATA